MLPLSSRIAFLVFAAITLPIGLWGFYGIYARVMQGRADSDSRIDHPLRRGWYALTTTLSQSRTFRKRPWISLFHSFIFYGFVFYMLVNLVDAVEGFTPFGIASTSALGAAYNFAADVLSFLVLLGVVALVLRRFLLPSRRDFSFNEKTLLQPAVKRGKISRDSIIVSAFILFHVGSRAVGAGAKLAIEGRDKFQPFASALSHLFNPRMADSWRIFGYWGALGSVLAFLAYFPYTKHVHIFMAPVKYFFARPSKSGALPLLEFNMEAADGEAPALGAKQMDELAWPRLLDAYACIQCNRCQDVCPASATGKALSPAALEINKRMALNAGAGSGGTDLLQAIISPESVWACTTCGACMEVCPVQDEQMLDIIDIRRNQVLVEGEFPAQLQTAFRGMERSKNPWGINHDQRLAWAEGLYVKTTDNNPEPDVLYWVGCAASYDPQAQKTARAFVQLLDHADVNYAVLGKKECCTGDTARRAGNEYLYRQLADENVSTLNAVKPKLVVTSCPHCMNSIGNEYKQIGGDYKVMHHTEYLESLVSAGRIVPEPLETTITYHDPCYLGRHNGVYDAPRNLLKILGSEMVELDRNRENAFCCGAGGAQFWKEEELGTERISENRFNEVQRKLGGANDAKTLAVGCPFCKSMLGSTPGKSDDIAIKDVAELLLEGVQKKSGVVTAPAVAAASAIAEPITEDVVAPTASVASAEVVVDAPVNAGIEAASVELVAAEPVSETAAPRKKWTPKAVAPSASGPLGVAQTSIASTPEEPVRKKWSPKAAIASAAPAAEAQTAPSIAKENSAIPDPQIERKKWQPKKPS